ncbi:MAG: tRNA (adenosine(37)-N6)-threonylcarbamoyltransferase complex dimerization subunit type 1 TsaB [Pseudomonadota bacterium]
MNTPVPLLALDCSSRWCVLALRSAAGVARYLENLDRGHSEHLLPAIVSLREQADLSDAPLAAVAVVVGPGSFTGVRIAVATAQALAFAYQCPVARLDALMVLAESADPGTHDDRHPAGVVCCARRSRGDLYYLGAYTQGHSGFERLGELELVGSREALDSWWQGCVQAGQCQGLVIPASATEAGWLGDAPHWTDAAVRAVDPDPDALLRCAERAFAAGQVVAAADALPLYLEADSPWQRSTS